MKIIDFYNNYLLKIHRIFAFLCEYFCLKKSEGYDIINIGISSFFAILIFLEIGEF